MFDIRLGTIYKEENSTKNTMASERTISGELKEGTGVLSPTFKLLLSTDIDIGGFNYCIVPRFGRAYWVNERYWDRGFWYIVCKRDPLGTYREDILSSTQYVVRAAADSDGAITDTMYVTKNKPVVHNQAFMGFPRPGIETGSFILGVVNDSADTIGACTYYVMTLSEISTFIGALMSETTLESIFYPTEQSEDMTTGLFKALFNPLQYITTCIFLPLDPNTIRKTASQGVRLGWWDLSVLSEAHAISPFKVNYTIDTTVLLHKHPQAASRGNYLNARPFTEIVLHLQPFGRIVIDPGYLMNETTFDYHITVDCLTGDARLDVTTTNDNPNERIILSQATANVAIKIPIAQMAANNSAMGTSIGNMISSIATLDVGGMISSVGDAISAQAPLTEIRGGTGGSLIISAPQHISQIHYLVVPEDNTHNGRPLCQRRTLRNLPGYVKCLNSSIEAGTSLENAEITQFLDTGVFIE